MKGYNSLIQFLISAGVLLISMTSLQAQHLEIIPIDNPVPLAPSQAPDVWYTDRYAPAAFEMFDFSGENVLKHSIDGINDGSANRGGQNSTFYNTQGRKYDLGTGVTKLYADIYIPADFENNHRRAGIWGTAADINNNVIPVYPILSFRNIYGHADSARFSYYSSNLGAWVDLPTTINYDQWYSFEIEIDLTNQQFIYYINGAQVGTDAASLGATTHLSNMILQAYNFNDPALPPEIQSTDSYDVYWDNVGSLSNIHNVTADTYHGTIQDAIDAATALDQINVGPGIFYQNSTLNINKSVSIIGDGSATTTLDLNALVETTSYGVTTTESDITFSGFTLLHPFDPGPVKNGFTFKAGNTSASPLNSNLTVSDLVIDGAERTPFDFHGIDGISVTGLQADNTTGGNGMQLTGCTDVTVNSFTGASNAWGSIAIYASRPTDRGSDNVTIDGSGLTIDGNVYAQDDINNPSYPNDLFNTNVSVTGWDYEVYNADFRSGGDGPEYTFYAESEADATSLAEGLNTANGGNLGSAIKQLSSGEFFVTNDNLAIQAAIDEALAGDIVNVSSGTYDENVTVDKALTLTGANANVTCGSRSAESAIAPAAGLPVNVTADGVTMNGFEINSPDYQYAILCGDRSDLSIVYNNINNIGTNLTSTNVHAIQYTVGSSTTLSNVTVSNNCFASISSSSLSGYSAAAIGFLQSTSLGTLTTLNIENNEIDDVEVNTGDWPTGKIAYGILINVGGNSSFATNGKVSSVTVSGNTVSNLSGFISTAIGLEGNTENVTANNNTVSGLFGRKTANRAGGGYDLQAVKIEKNRFAGTITLQDNAFETSTFTHDGAAGRGYGIANYMDAGSWGAPAATCNWFGTDVATEIADQPNLDGKILNKTGAETPFIPFNTSATGPCDGDWPVVNTTQSLNYLSIQEGIDGANANDVLEVAAGTYSEVLLVDKPLTLLGPNSNISAVTGTRNAEAVLNERINVSANDGVTISGFEFLDVVSSSTWTIYIQGNSNNFTFENNRFINIERDAIRSGMSSSTGNVTVKGNLIEGLTNTVSSGIILGGIYGTSVIADNKIDLAVGGTPTGYAGIQTPSADGLTISGNEISNTTNQGLQLAGQCGDVTIENNVITNTNSSGGSDKGAIRIYGTAFTGTITISGNTLTNSFNGFAVKDGEDITGKNITVTNNDLSGNSNMAIYNGASAGTLEATCNWFGTTDPVAINGMITGDVNFIPFNTTATGPCDGQGPVVNTTQSLSYMTIQEGIDGANAGDVIDVAAGTYNETATIDKSLTLNGANADVDPCNGTRTAESIISDGQILIASDNVTVNGFEVTGTNAQIKSNTNGSTWSNANILYNYIHATTAAQPILHGFGNGGGIGTSTWDVSWNKIEDIHQNNATAIVLFNISDLTVSNNCISHTETTLAGDQGRRGMNIDGGQTVIIDNNTVDMGLVAPVQTPPNYPNFYAARYPLQIAQSDRPSNATTISNNTFMGSYDGIVTLGNDAGDVNNLTIINNTFSDFIYAVRLNAAGGAPVGLLDGLDISGNVFTDVSKQTIRFTGSGTDFYNNVTINNNELTGGGELAISIADNNAFVNTPDATCNWWGTTDPLAIENSISGTTDWSPFQSSNGGACDGVAPVNNTTQNTQFASIQLAVDNAIANDVIEVAAGTYTENLTLDKKVHLLGSVDMNGDPTVFLQSASDNPLVSIAASGNSTADPLLIKDFEIQTDAAGSDQGSRTGIEIGTGSFSFIELDNVDVYGNNHAYPGLEYGFSIYGDQHVDELVIKNSSFQDLSYGFFAGAINSGSPGSLTNVTINNSTFHHNSSKGLYFEMLSNATLSNLTITDNGSDQSLVASWALAWGTGLDINLKYNNYSNIIMSALTASGNGLDAQNGAAIAIKARDDGDTYGANPATLNNVYLLNSNITGNERGVRFGEPGKENATPTSVTISSNTFEENRKSYSSNDGGNYGDLINDLRSSPSVDLTYAGATINGGQAVWNIVNTETLIEVFSNVSDNDIVKLEAGTYNESISIVNDGIEVIGLGAGATLSGPGSYGVSLAADNVSLENLTVTGFDDGMDLGTSDGLNLNDCHFDNNNSEGMRVGSGASVTNLSITDCSFDNNVIGWYISNASSGSGSHTFDQITVENTTFNGNEKKGIYAEKMSNATFDNITVDGSGVDPTYNFNNGIDINLKWSDYSNITITNSTIINSGIAGPSSHVEAPAAVAIKARDDGSYTSPPATLSNVTITYNVISGPENGLRFGEFGTTNNGPLNIQVNNNDLSAAFANDAFTYNVNGADVDAACNWWGSASGPDAGDITNGGSGNVYSDPWLSTSDIFDPSCTGISCASITPTNLNAINITNTSADITWNSVPGAISYQIWTSITGVVNVGTSTSYNLSGLDPGKTYTWYVRSICGGGQSSAWTQSTFMTTGVACPDADEDDFNMNETNITNTSADLNWDPISGAISYRIWTSITGVVNVGTSTSYNLSGLDPGKTYTWYVRSICGGGQSSDWIQSSFMTTGVACPDADADDFNMNETNITNTSADLNWDPIQGAISYKIWTSITGVVNVGTSTTYNISGLDPGTTYIWYVRSICGGGQSSAWIQSSFMTTGTACINVDENDFNMNETSIMSTSADLNWDPIAGAVSYSVWTSFTGVVNVGASTTYNISGLSPSTTYTWYVRAYCGGGQSSDWSQSEFTTLPDFFNLPGTATTRSNLEKDNQPDTDNIMTVANLVLYPNPVINSRVTVEFEDENRKIERITIMGVTGQIHYTVENIDSYTYNIELPLAINSGTYLVVVYSSDAVFHKKLVIQ